MGTDTSSSIELPAELQSALNKLRQKLAGSLSDAKLQSCGAAWAEIERLKSAPKKRDIVQERVRQWTEGSASAIRTWLPTFLELGRAAPQISESDVMRWTKDQIWEAVEAQINICRPEDQKRLAQISRTMVYWFAVASQGNFEVNFLPLSPWRAPRWLSPNPIRTDSLLRQTTRRLRHRIDYVINETLETLSIQMVIARATVMRPVSVATTLMQIAQCVLESQGVNQRLPPEFVTVAGQLWGNAERKNRVARVSKEQLERIAHELDTRGYIPPKNFLEKRFADEVKAFNSRNANSKTGAIMTWSDLVSTGDKDHVRGMRKLLSRCSKKQLLQTRLSAN